MRTRTTCSSPANAMVLVAAVTAIWLATAIFSEQAMASSTTPDVIDDECYYDCYNNCLETRYYRVNPLFCVENCQTECKIHNVHHDASYYCNIGCSLNMCHHLGHDKEKTAGCLQDCSKKHCKAKNT